MREASQLQDYINAIDTALPETQRLALRTFISAAKETGLSTEALSKVASVGAKVLSVPDDITKPDAYNTAIMAGITDIMALYTGLDTVAGVVRSNNAINDGEADRMMAELGRMEQVLSKSIRLHGSSADYTHVIHHTFDTDDGSSSLLPPDLQRLTIDTKDFALKRPMGLDISMVMPNGKYKMCEVSVDKMLGLSAETRHGVSEAIDGSTDTCWREVIYTDAPIFSSPKVVSWLPSNYRGGAAVRLKFEFESVVTVSDLVIKGLTPYPMDILEVAWASPSRGSKETGGTVYTNGNFGTLSGWTEDGDSDATVSIVSQGSHNGTSCVAFAFPDSESMITRSVSRGVKLTPSTQYTVSFYAWGSGISNQIQISLSTLSSSGGSVVREEPAFTESSPYWVSSRLGWTKYSHTFTTSSNCSTADLLIEVSSEGGEVRIDDLQISSDYFTFTPRLTTAGAVTTIPLVSTNGQPISTRTIWLTLAQPNFAVRHMSIPKSMLDLNEMWTLALDSEGGAVYTPEEADWRGSFAESPNHQIIDGDSTIARLASKLGGRIKTMLLNLLSLAYPTNETVSVVKYEYVIGAWEIDFRFRDYTPTGYWASWPLGLTGELRQLTLVPDSDPAEEGKINYYIAARADESLDPDNLYQLQADKTVYFKGVYEEESSLSMCVSGDESLVMRVHPKPMKFTELGTDRYNKLRLPSYPSVDLDKIIGIHNTLRTVVSLGGENPNRYNHYDPNAVFPCYVRTDSGAPATGAIDSIDGYVPIKVTLKIGDTTVPPDTVGVPYYTRYRLVEAEELTSVTDGMVIKLATLIQENQGSTGSSITKLSKETIERVAKQLGISTSAVTSLVQKTAEKSTTSTQESTQRVETYITKYPIVWVEGLGPRLALYWKDVSTSALELIPPSTYNIRWSQSVATVGYKRYGNKKQTEIKSSSRIELNITDLAKFSETLEDGSAKYKILAYYRTEIPTRPSVGTNTDEYTLFTAADNSMIPLVSLQNYPVTRNMTDYISGTIPTLTPADMNPTSRDYYPVFEYYLDSSGNLVFANDLFTYGDTPAVIDVEYETLDINPIVVVEYSDPVAGSSACRTPVLHGYTLLLNVRT
jgi:hypothetical protein